MWQVVINGLPCVHFNIVDEIDNGDGDGDDDGGVDHKMPRNMMMYYKIWYREEKQEKQ